MHTEVGSSLTWHMAHEACLLCIKKCVHSYLIFMARALAVLGQALQGLDDQRHILLIDVQPQQAQAACCTPTDAVQKLKGLTHKVVICFVVLTP